MLRAIGSKVVIAQTRGQDFVDTMITTKGKYEVDTVQRDGKILTEVLDIEAVGTLGHEQGKQAFMKLPSKLPKLKYVGVGVTEGGINKDSQAMKDLAEFLYHCSQALPSKLTLTLTLRTSSRLLD
jgi:hypothetical protein